MGREDRRGGVCLSSRGWGLGAKGGQRGNAYQDFFRPHLLSAVL